MRMCFWETQVGLYLAHAPIGVLRPGAQSCFERCHVSVAIVFKMSEWNVRKEASRCKDPNMHGLLRTRYERHQHLLL